MSLLVGRVLKFGQRERRDFSRIQSSLELPNLIEIQKDSFDWFVTDGVKELFDDIFPIEGFQGNQRLEANLRLEYVSHSWGQPKYELNAAKEHDVNYSRPLRAVLRLYNNETGEVKEQEVFMGDIPLMTDAGTFIINGAERVVVSQLVRSPGVYLAATLDKSGKRGLGATVIPNRGAWLEYETDIKDITHVRIDRTRKLPLTVLLRALGLSSDIQILDLFGDNTFLLNTLEKDQNETPEGISGTENALLQIYERLRPGEPATIDGATNLFISRFFDDKRYDLARVGRYKFNKKLNVLERLDNRVLAEAIISADGEVLAEAGTRLNRRLIEQLRPEFEAGANVQTVMTNDIDGRMTEVQVVKVYADDKQERVVNVMGNYNVTEHYITISDILASVSYFFNLLDGVGTYDDIDHLGNRRIRSVGELLQNQFRIGLTRMERVVRERMSIQETEGLTPQSLINVRPVVAVIKEFFGSSQLSQFMDQTNPLAELTHKRRLSALGPGGLTRERAGMEVRDVHYSHYGRMCPIETPEGPNIGLINTLSTFARLNEYGFIQTPYRKINHVTLEDGSTQAYVTDEVIYVTADEEDHYIVAQANMPKDHTTGLIDPTIKEWAGRHRGKNDNYLIKDFDLVDVSPKQIVSVATACIPFLEHDDANRALMGANMQRQAVPLLVPEAAYVGTGMEHVAARDSGVAVLAHTAGTVEYVDARQIKIRNNAGHLDVYPLSKFERSNQGACYNHRPIIHLGDEVEARQIIADGSSMDEGEMALGRNVVVAFMTWNGYNYEDAIIMSERLVKDDVYTSVHIEEYEIECRDTKLGPEEITRDIPNVGEVTRKDLDDRGIIRIGAEVKAGDILVGKVTPKGVTELSPEERLLHAIFGEKAREVRDTSLHVPHGGDGIILDVKRFTRENGDELSPGVNEVVRVYIVQKRKISEGDKMAGRHGNKGVISRILPVEDMPYLPDGTPVDIMLNPLGVPSRMNIGQILEIHLGMAARRLVLAGKQGHVATSVFDGCKQEDLEAMMAEAGMDHDGKTELYDGRTGELFDNRVSVGVMYMIKLAHMVDDKLHARSNGPYSLVTQQPLGGKAQFGGQRFGEMEVWALEAYGAANTLREILTIKSDDVMGRGKTYEAIVKGKPIPKPGVPESFRVLIKELQSLGINVRIYDNEDEVIDISESEEE